MSLAVCRVCLANNIRMKTIANTELQILFEKLTNNKLIADDGMPQSVCYVCLLLLQRCCKFVEVSQRSEKFLTQLLHDGIELTQETLSRTNDSIQNALYSLSVSDTTFVSILHNFKDENCKVNIKTKCDERYIVVIEKENTLTAEIPVGNKNMIENKEKCSILPSPKGGENSKIYFIKQEILSDKPVIVNQQNNTKKKLKEDTKTSDKKSEKDKIIPKLVKHPDYKLVKTNKKETQEAENNLKTNKITYKCNKCPKAFRQKWYLKKHMSFHAGEKPYVCSICAAGFNTPVLLKQHKATHTDTPFSCHICFKQFGKKPQLTEHIRTHTGEKPHSCDTCHVTFAHIGSLSRHMRTHTGEKPYICHKCSRQFVQSSNLKKHIRSCHKKEIADKVTTCVKCRHFVTESG